MWAGWIAKLRKTGTAAHKNCCFAPMLWQEYLDLSVSKWLCRRVPIMVSFSDPCLWLITRQMRMIIKKPQLSDTSSSQILISVHRTGMFVCLSFISSECETGHPTRSDRRGSCYSSGATRTIIIFSFLMILCTRNEHCIPSWKWIDTDPPSTQTVNYHFC